MDEAIRISPESSAARYGPRHSSGRGAVSYVSAENLGREVSKALHIAFAVDPPLGDYRVSLNAVGLKPKELADALSVPLNGTTVISVQQTPEQAALADRLATQMTDQRDPLTPATGQPYGCTGECAQPRRKKWCTPTGRR